MSLNFDLSKVHNWREIDPAVRESIIWDTMIVGIGEITEATAEKFYARVRAYESITENVLYEFVSDDEPAVPRPATPADVRSMIGLKTNVFPTETDAKFARKLLGWATDHAAREWKAANINPEDGS